MPSTDTAPSSLHRSPSATAEPDAMTEDIDTASQPPIDGTFSRLPPGHQSQASILTLPDDLLLELTYHLTPIDAFKLSLTCSRWHGLMGDAYWRNRAKASNIVLSPTPSAMCQLFGILEAFCHHCCIPLLVPRQQLAQRGWPALTAREYDFWPDAVPHNLCQRWFCIQCIRLPAFQYLPETLVSEWGLSLQDLIDLPCWIAEGIRFFRLLHITERQAQKRALLQQYHHHSFAQRGNPALDLMSLPNQHLMLRHPPFPESVEAEVTPSATFVSNTDQTKSISTAFTNIPASCPPQDAAEGSHELTQRGASYQAPLVGSVAASTSAMGTDLTRLIADDHSQVVKASISLDASTDVCAGIKPARKKRLHKDCSLDRQSPPRAKKTKASIPMTTMNREQLARQIESLAAEKHKAEMQRPRKRQTKSMSNTKTMANNETGEQQLAQADTFKESSALARASIGRPQGALHGDNKASQRKSPTSAVASDPYLSHEEDLSETDPRWLIMRQVKLEQLSEALLHRGFTLTSAAMTHPDIQLWINGDWLKMAENGIRDLPDLIDVLVHRYGGPTSPCPEPNKSLPAASDTSDDHAELARSGRPLLTDQQDCARADPKRKTVAQHASTLEIEGLGDGHPVNGDLFAAAQYAGVCSKGGMHSDGRAVKNAKQRSSPGTEGSVSIGETRRRCPTGPNLGAVLASDSDNSVSHSSPAKTSLIGLEDFGLGHLYSTLTTAAISEESRAFGQRADSRSFLQKGSSPRDITEEF